MNNQIQPTSEDKRKMLEELKANWKQDPCWDIEDTEGFEEFHDELLSWRMAYESQRDEEARKRLETHHKDIKSQLGINNVFMSFYLHTFEEIEMQLSRVKVADDNIEAQIAREQVRALLILAVQVKRVGDLLEDKIEMDASDNNLDFMTRLYSK